MTPKEMPPKDDSSPKTEPSEPAGVHEHDKHRKHGYRGYPNNPELGGDIHAGTGFGGVGSTGRAGGSGPGIVGEKTRESVEELGEKEEE